MTVSGRMIYSMEKVRKSGTRDKLFIQVISWRARKLGKECLSLMRTGILVISMMDSSMEKVNTILLTQGKSMKAISLTIKWKEMELFCGQIK
jgi:hypothetical protein